VPGIQERYQRVVEAFPDLSREEVRKAVEKAGALEARLKDGYRILRDEDPDALQGIDSVRVKGMVWAVGRDLGSSDPALRERAARTLGLLSHPEGVSLLRGALRKEAEGAVADAMADALLRIGGSKGATALADFHADPRHDGRCLEALVRLAGRNPVDRRIAAVQMGRYAGARDEGCFRRMVEVLRGMGYDGAIGLASSLDNNSTHARIVHVIGVLADTKLPRVARVVSRYFQASRVPADGQVREAALQAVRKLAKPANAGEAVVPQLFHALRFEATRWQTTELLRELTGQEFTVKQWGRWSAWWKSRHPDWKEDGGAR
jgi:hypothetical protein